MATCCGPARVSAPKRLELACPQCGDKGRTVNNVTVASLVAAARNDEVGADDYNLCLRPDCEIVYYTADRRFRTGDMAVRIAFKDPAGPVTVCYCHRLSEDDVIHEMRTNVAARSFEEVSDIFGMKDCSCERHHPFGGNCACATAVARAVKKGLADPAVIQIDRSRASIPRVHIFEQTEGCCGSSGSNDLVGFLRKKLADRADVRTFDLARGGSPPVPTALVTLMAERGAACLPAFTVDGAVMTSGTLPNFMQAIAFINGSATAKGNRAHGD